ncbi:hypothetical protein BOX15_Mlig004845g1 [Macrostomum lignano]|uniref:Uncharacterized protein n=1 Tax=Macrostomum lignano TaxID=282301 RepID=A0A267G5W7_9PLAT|nr:hypothetical protein BOX15_Mlig019575g1 [Macrostomum lignano]PAA81411.1 hypothetical protein BOX15_Mlig004845g1 [Macrostomum lignano]
MSSKVNDSIEPVAALSSSTTDTSSSNSSSGVYRRPDQAKYVPPGRRALLIREAEEADDCRRRREADEQRRRREARREAADREKWVRRRPTALATESTTPDIASLSLSPTNSSSIDTGKLGHLMELYDFASDLHVDDVGHSLRRFGQPRIQFVDDGHLLAAFASAGEAEQAAMRPPDCLRMRPVSQASPAVAAFIAACVASNQTDTTLAPAKRRPETDVKVAHRFIRNHLGGARASSAGLGGRQKDGGIGDSRMNSRCSDGNWRSLRSQ